MKSNLVSRLVLTGALLASSLNTVADSQIVVRAPDELRAIAVATRAVASKQVVSTDKDLTNWDVNILKGCWLYKVEVSRTDSKIVSKDYTNYCGNVDKIRSLRAEAREYSRTHR
ncbi:hypothetical protein ACKLNO_08945 [Neisseriaceae bacterium B1]